MSLVLNFALKLFRICNPKVFTVRICNLTHYSWTDHELQMKYEGGLQILIKTAFGLQIRKSRKFIDYIT